MELQQNLLDMGCENSADLRYLVTNADLLRLFKKKCEGFEQGSVDSLVDDLMNIAIADLDFLIKPDGVEIE